MGQSIVLNQSIENKKILVAPLNWGLGHAVRCIPIIQALKNDGFIPVVASDGDSLSYLRQIFPNLSSYELPSTSVEYTSKGSLLKYKLLQQAPVFLKTVYKERKCVQEIHCIEQLSGIISDNRFGIRLEGIPSIYITHQLQVLSGSTSRLTTRIHENIISRFDECWVPDFQINGLAGLLSRPKAKMEKVRFIGPLSSFKKEKKEKKIDILVILSGPEPQRSLLESKIKEELSGFNGVCLIVRGLIEKKQVYSKHKNITLVNFMLRSELKSSIAESHLVISRSGYTSIMDYYMMESKAFFVPTPGQNEQEYLAENLKEQGVADYSRQSEFSLDKVKNSETFKGFKHKKTSNPDFDKSLFDVFKKTFTSK
ncbi:glycosyltransferase [Lutimonas zeaxanthinifaciens]|uniref:glycosyltransferase n=1 Tax=Lutimonas zeaxanthinifaciens TaxID=3060215 RepID=UPI00265CDA95|nr:glycosyltransferase [Lutimonas sp. YSD2104]WKK66060.1 glycosyltransferase [Lutimonas sp. YSD2104]